MTIRERIDQEIFSSPIFETAHKLNPNLKKLMEERIVPIAGDLLLDNLGMNEQDRALLIQELDVIINCAASINFDDHLHDAIRINYFGTLKML